jgi:ABC-type branched-subunit amino acid transport system substrate-binding protein
MFAFSLPIQVQAQAKEPLKIGMTGPLSGPTAPNGFAVMHGTKALFKRINDTGGIHGRKVELVHFDDGYEPERTLKGYEKLVKQDKVFAFLTVYGAPNMMAIAPALDRDDIPVVGPISAGNLTEPVRKNIFMVRMSGADEAEHMVDKAVSELGIKEFGVFYQDDAFGASGRAGAQKALAARKLELKAQGTYKRNTSDVKAGVEAIGKKVPAVVITGLAPATVEFIKEMTAKGAKPVYFGGSPVSAPMFIKKAAELKIEYFSALVTPLPTDTSLEIVKQYRADMKAAGSEEHVDHIYGLEGYINAAVLIAGLKAAGADPTRDKLRKGLESLSSLDLGGLTVSYSPTNHKGLSRLYMTKLEGGKLVPVSNLSIATAR